MARFARLVFFLLAVVTFILLFQWSYSDGEDPRQFWEDTQDKVNEWWSPDDTHSHDQITSYAGDVEEELKHAKIFTDVIDKFTPKLKLEVSWDSGKVAKLGNVLKPVELQKQPVLKLTVFPTSDDDAHPADEPLPVKMDEEDEPDEMKDPDISFPKHLDEEDEPNHNDTSTYRDDSDESFGTHGSKPSKVAVSDKDKKSKRASFTKKEYVIIMTDPDAPSREDPKNSEYCHWIGADLHLQTDEAMWSGDTHNLVEYTPPAPPEGTGKHRYVFLVFMASSGSDKDLDVTVPDERKSWGFGKKRHGVRQWAEENDLVPVAANFIYAKNDKDF